MHAILIVGLHSSGKTTLSQALASTGAYSVLELGDGVRAEAHKQHETNLVRVASQILSGPKPDLLARLAMRRANSLRNKIPVFVGARTLLERDTLKLKYENMIVIGLKVPNDVRRARWKNRQIMATDKWSERERCESKWHTQQLVLESDLVLNDHQSIPNMCQQIANLLSQRWRD